MQNSGVDRFELLDMGDLYMLINLVHGLANQTKLGNRAVVFHIPRVRGAPRGAEFRGNARFGFYGAPNHIRKLTGWGQEAFAGDLCGHLEPNTCLCPNSVHLGLDPCDQRG